MAAGSRNILTVRRWTSEPDATTYVDADLTDVIERYPLTDADGNEPSASEWTATYDLHMAAADIWQEKATAVIGDYDFAADGGRYDRNQVYKAMMYQSQYHRSQRRVSVIVQERWPTGDDESESGHVINA